MKTRGYTSLAELLEDMTMEVVFLENRWKYYAPPKLVIEQKNGLTFFLRPNSNKWEFLPKN